MKLAPLTLAVGLALASPSYALVITTSASTAATVVVDGVTQTTSDGPGSAASSSLVGQSYGYSEYPYTVGMASATADSAGQSVLSSSGPEYTSGSYFPNPLSVSVQSSVLQRATITNDSAFAQQVDFNFLVAAGSLLTTYGQGGNSAFDVGYSANISVNGGSRWFSAASLQTNSVNYNQLSRSGSFLSNLGLSEINDNLQNWNGSYSWDAYTGNLNLGVLSAGQSLVLEYALNTYVDVYLDEQGYSALPSATIGDPFDFNSTPVFAPEQFVTAVVPSVPEPETVAMFGVGLAALAFRRKSRKAQA